MRTATRELATDYRQLEKKEKELVFNSIRSQIKMQTFQTQEIQIKQLARAGQNEACKVLAKQLVQLRKQKTKNIGASTTVSAVSSKNQLVYLPYCITLPYV
jgi:charged multivesicular body protein 2B